MINDNTKPTTLHDQLLFLSKQAGQVGEALNDKKSKVAKDTVEKVNNLETSLVKLSEKMKLFEAEHSNLSALAGIGEIVNSTLELDIVLQTVMDTIIRLSRAERGFLMLRDENGKMKTRVARNWEQESIKSEEMAVSGTIIEKVIQEGTPILTTNAVDDPRFGNQDSIVAFNLRSILCVPLKVKDELIGVIYADNRIRSGIFTEKERDLLTTFSNQAAVAIENARLFSSLKYTLAEVTELKNLMDNIFDSITSGVITADIENQVTLCNRAAEKILGYAADEVIGRPLNEILSSVVEDIEPHLVNVRTTNTPVVDLEISHTLPMRGAVDWRLNLSPLKDADQSTQGIAIVLDDMTERKRLEAQRRLFERMVSPAVIKQLDPDGLKLGGQRADITVLFADIRGFTAYSEAHSPEQLVSVLNRYLGAMAEAVLSHEGTIDKFMGDSIMAWFNAPIKQKDHTLRAVRTAVLIRQMVEELYKELPKDSHLSFGVGIHYGDAVLGLIGTDRRMEYTAISDTVNTAKRIQENSLDNQILITATTYERVKNEIVAEPFTSLSVKGKSKQLEVYEVRGIK